MLDSTSQRQTFMAAFDFSAEKLSGGLRTTGGRRRDTR